MSEPTLQDCINYMRSQIKQMEKHPRNYEFNLPYYRKTVELLEKAQRPHGKCNQCRYYDGVRGVQGHAPCWHWNIGGVMWNDYCSRFEKEGDEK